MKRTIIPRINGLILAGGRAKRMGDEDKGLILFDGKCLIEHCIAKLQPQVENLFISANRNTEQYEQYGFTVLQDRIDDFQGPLAGLLSGLKSFAKQPLLVTPCDAPLLPSDLGHRLLESYVSEDILAVIPHDGTRLQPLFGLYAPGSISSLRAYLASGQRKVETWATSLPHVVVDFANQSECFKNINTPNDLQEALSILRKPSSH